MIPGLENAEFLRYGIMHRNTYLSSPGMLGRDYAMLERPEKISMKQYLLMLEETKNLG